jgi:hypothetical protein
MRHRFLLLTAVVLLLIGAVLSARFIDAIPFVVRSSVDGKVNEEEEMLTAMLATNPGALFSTYAAYLQEHPTRTVVCHGILHRVGHTALETLGWERAMAIANPLCGGGYIHGVIEAKFGVLVDLRPQLLQVEIAIACGDPRNEVCYHGIGHGLMVVYHNDIRAALLACDMVELPGRLDCYDGVFMHVFDAEETGIMKDIPEREQGVDYCMTIVDEQRPSCLFYAPRIVARTPHMVASAVAMCQGMDDEESRRICAIGAGHMFEKYFLPDHAFARSQCAFFRKDVRDECNEGADMYRDFQEGTALPSMDALPL